MKLSRSLAGILVLFLILVPTLAYSSSPQGQDLQQIRRKYKRWDSEREELRKTELTKASQPAAEGSKAYAYRKAGKILIVDESYFAETGQATWSFYYEDGRPFFILETETRYAFPITVNADDRKKLGGGEDKTTENRYYFRRQKLIRWLEGKKTIPARGERFREQSQSVLDLASSAYRNALTISVRAK